MPVGTHAPRGGKRVRLGGGASLFAGQGNVAAPIGEKDDERRAAPAAFGIGEHARGDDPGGERRTPAARQRLQRTLGARQRARRRQQNPAPSPRKAMSATSSRRT